MSNSQTQTLSPEASKLIQDQMAQQKFNELTELSRVIANAINLVCSNDIQIPSTYAKAVYEIQTWLQGMHQNVQTQLDAVKDLLPKPVAVEAPKEAVVVKEEPKAAVLEELK